MGKEERDTKHRSYHFRQILYNIPWKCRSRISATFVCQLYLQISQNEEREEREERGREKREGSTNAAAAAFNAIS